MIVYLLKIGIVIEDAFHFHLTELSDGSDIFTLDDTLQLL